jgi:hypothetical protein
MTQRAAAWLPSSCSSWDLIILLFLSSVMDHLLSDSKCSDCGRHCFLPWPWAAIANRQLPHLPCWSLPSGRTDGTQVGRLKRSFRLLWGTCSRTGEEKGGRQGKVLGKGSGGPC